MLDQQNGPVMNIRIFSGDKWSVSFSILSYKYLQQYPAPTSKFLANYSSKSLSVMYYYLDLLPEVFLQNLSIKFSP